MNLTLARNSTDNPIFPRRGSEFLGIRTVTPPYSLFSNKDYSVYGKDEYDEAARCSTGLNTTNGNSNQKPIPLLKEVRNVRLLMTRAEFGLLGHYNNTRNHHLKHLMWVVTV